MSELLQSPTETSFGPEKTHIMGQAFDLVREYAIRSGQVSLVTAEGRKQIARRIIEMAATGESDPEKLADYAITLLKI